MSFPIEFQTGNLCARTDNDSILFPLEIRRRSVDGQQKLIVKIDTMVRDILVKTGLTLLGTLAVMQMPLGLTVVCLTTGFLAKGLTDAQQSLEESAKESSTKAWVGPAALGTVAATLLVPVIPAIYASVRAGGMLRDAAERKGWM